MLHFNLTTKQVVDFKDVAAMVKNGDTVVNRWDFVSLKDAEDVVALFGDNYMAVDAGAWVSNQYDVIEKPKVGDVVSRGFNGDYYPAGEIVKISKTMKKITTSTGVVFNRKKLTGCWKANETWTMVPGMKNEKNPSF